MPMPVPIWLTEDVLLLQWPGPPSEPTLQGVHHTAYRLRKETWLSDVTAAYTAVAVHGVGHPADPVAVVAACLAAASAAAADLTDRPRRHWQIPVVYDGQDLPSVATALGLTKAAVIARHAATPLTVAMLGFLPGFAYLQGVDPLLALPRRDLPRAVPSGAVLLAAGQTAVMPSAGLSGWYVLGHADFALWDDTAPLPCPLQPLDTVSFVPVAVHSGHPPVHKQTPAVAPLVGPVLEVLQTGPLLTVQGPPRRARQWALAEAGPADPNLAQLANRLLQQDPRVAVLEWQGHGPTLQVGSSPVHLAWTGDAPVWLDGEPQLPCQSAWLLPGQVVQIGAGKTWRLGYVAVARGLPAAEWLGSVSVQTTAPVGPRPLQAGAQLTVAGAVLDQGDWTVTLPAPNTPVVLRVLRGPEAQTLGDTDWQNWLQQPWRAGPGDRMAQQLLPHPDAPRLQLPQLVSGPVAPGVVQLPPQGTPLVLGPDAQTTGGYPRMAAVIGPDRRKAAQLLPGQAVVLVEVTMDQLVELQAAEDAVWVALPVQRLPRHHSRWLLQQARLGG
jgi:KipI family sensor histidine kinase inhibitor